MLKEHFRCVSPIIEYSKREFYNHELKPVRLPKSSERLDPPWLMYWLRIGFRKGDINHPEAQYIVNEIKEICDDPAIKNATLALSLSRQASAQNMGNAQKTSLAQKKLRSTRLHVVMHVPFKGRSVISCSSMVVSPGGCPRTITRFDCSKI
jgi:hypothetical protein